MSDLTNWPRNRLLLALSPSNLKRLMPQLEHIRCQANEVLIDADSSLDHVYFPDSGVISIVAVYADGSEIEMATIGREGCSGLQAVFGRKTSSVRLLVQIPGTPLGGVMSKGQRERKVKLDCTQIFHTRRSASYLRISRARKAACEFDPDMTG